MGVINGKIKINEIRSADDLKRYLRRKKLIKLELETKKETAKAAKNIT